MKLCLFTISVEGFKLPPYALWTLKSYINKYGEENGIEVDISILNFKTSDSKEEILRTIDKEEPDVIGASHYIWNDRLMLEVIPNLKEIKTSPYVVIGGPQVDVLDKRLIILLKNALIDCMVIGEGEEQLLHILNCLVKGKEVSSMDGMILHQNNQVTSYIPLKRRTGGIDFLPNPYKFTDDLLEKSLFAGSVQYETSRGCPFSCTFCDQGHKSYRSLTLERIKDDLSYFAQNNVKHIDFLDGTFNLNPKRTIEILNYIIDLKQDWTFHAEIKPELLTKNEIELMKIANCKTVELGLQTIHTSTLRLIKRKNDYEKLEKTVQYLLDSNIEVIINTIIGLPTETIDEWFDSLDYCFNLGNVSILSNILKILPNTEMSRQVDQFGYVYDELKFNAIIKTSKISEEDLKLAETINKLVNIFWNTKKTQSVRIICERFYMKKFHKLLLDISYLILKNKELLKSENFIYDVLLSLVEDQVNLDKDEQSLIINQLNHDYKVSEVNYG